MHRRRTLLLLRKCDRLSMCRLFADRHRSATISSLEARAAQRNADVERLSTQARCTNEQSNTRKLTLLIKSVSWKRRRSVLAHSTHRCSKRRYRTFVSLGDVSIRSFDNRVACGRNGDEQHSGDSIAAQRCAAARTVAQRQSQMLVFRFPCYRA
jgi:hypothetical protein